MTLSGPEVSMSGLRPESRLILVVDDEPHIRSLLRLKLTSAGYGVATADDGEQGLQAAIESRPDLIVTDLQMPHLSGLQLSERLRGRAETRRIPLILLTGRDFSLPADTPDEHQNIRQVLTKPFSPIEILSKIERVLSASAHEQQ